MHWLARGALAATALSLVGAASLSRTAGILANTAVVAVLAGLMLRARRGEPLLRPTRTWMLAALLAGFTAGVGAVADSLLRPDAAYPRAGDLLELLYIPCTLVALTKVPLKRVRRGFRARALSDGLVAATSLLYLLEPLLDGVSSTHTTWYAATVALAIPLGGVFIVAASLTALARCADEARPMLVWLALGVSMMATADLVYAVSPDAVPGPRRALLQLGLTTLVGAAVARRGRAGKSLREVPPALAVLPFLPFAGCVVLSTQLVLTGHGLDPDQLVLAILVALALVLRQYVGNRDKSRLVDELAGREARLHHELRTDRLTGLANRLGLEESLTRALHAPAHAFGLVVVDLDDFKLVNDNHGHSTGDAVLQEIAGRLTSCVRGDDVVARLGGDEFAVLLNGDEHVLSAVSERLVAALAVPVVVGERHFRLSASVGLVRKEEGDTVAQLLADADGAMYAAKADRGAGSFVHLDQAGRQTVAWRSLVREQVANPALEQFEVHYQPVVDLATGALCGMEALLRWNHPTIGRVPPDAFIPLAEQCGSIAVLGDFVLTTAVRDLAALARLRPEAALRVGVNVSPRQLTSTRFAQRVAQVLEETGVAPGQLIVEITEQAFEADLESMRQTVRELIAAGVELAVDDFGTGYASMQYLQRLDLSVLKVDRSFVAGIGEDGRPERLLDGISALAHRMNLQLVAEGIETPDQLALLRTLGCELGQGYLFDRPLPLDVLSELVRCGHVYDVQHPQSAVPHPRPAAESMQPDPAS